LTSRELPDYLSFSINQVGITIHHSNIQVRIKVGNGFGDSVRQIGVVRVQPGKDLALGTLEAFVDGVSLALVWLGHPPSQAIAVSLDDLKAPIIRSAIYDDIFELGIVLREYRLDGFFQKIGLIIRWRNNRD
jgi:hypothetical protein